MEHTANYQLSQWEKTDRIMMEDFNGDNAKVEEALTALAAKDAALQQELGGQFNWMMQRFYAGTRVGTDSDGDPSFRFPTRPLLVVMASAQRDFLIAVPTCGMAYGKLFPNISSCDAINCSVSGGLFTWGSGFCDQKNVLYHVFAILS